MHFQDYAQIVFSLLQNTALLALGVMGYCQVRHWFQDRLGSVSELYLYGFVFGLLGVLTMLAPIDVGEGVRLDLRNATIAVPTLLGGLVAGTVTTAVVVAFRVALGGGGMLAGIVSMLTTFALSVALTLVLRWRQQRAGRRELAWLGIAVGVFGLAVIGLFPRPDIVTLVLYEVAPVWIAMMPLTILFLGAIILHFERSQVLRRALEDREADLRAILDNAPMAIFLKDMTGVYRLVNRSYEEWYGQAAGEVCGRTDDQLYSPERAAVNRRTDEEVLKLGRDVRIERETSGDPPGVTRNLLTVKFPVRDGQGRIVGIAGFARDITLRRQAEKALQASEERFRALIEYANEIVAVLQPDGSVTYRAPSTADGLGYATAATAADFNTFDHVHPDDMQDFKRLFAFVAASPGERATGRTRFRHINGTWRHLAWSARNAMDVPSVQGIIVNYFDVTERQLLEEQLAQAQKMEAVGRLAGGIAHDFNNILGAIAGFAGFLAQDLDRATPQHGFAQRILTACERAKDIIQQILTFSRRGDVKREPHDIARLVRETEDLIRAALPSSTRLTVTAAGEGLTANVNAAQISQILLNLVLNSNDALNGQPGSIDLDVSMVRPGDADYELFETSAEARSAGECIHAGTLGRHRTYVRLTVKDTGGGMDAAVLKRIFDPFFTTKERGRGTGLGLSVVHGIVAGYDGACMVTSRAGRGTTFSVYLPWFEMRATPLAPSRAAQPLAGHERVLVVDDEADVRDALALGLERLGYEVVALGSPEEALDAVAEDPRAWDIIVSDEVMHGMKGLTFLQRVRALAPAVKFILCTGFGDGATEEAAWNAGVDKFFTKPVELERIAAGIREIVDTPTARQA